MFNYPSSSSSFTKKQKEADLNLAVHVAVHSSIRTIDHLEEVLRYHGKGSKLENFRMHKTKFSVLIKNVIAPVFLNNLVSSIRDSYPRSICNYQT